jgi:hypothetical protein
VNAIVDWLLDQVKKTLNGIISSFTNLALLCTDCIRVALNETMIAYDNYLEHGDMFDQAYYIDKLVFATLLSPVFITLILAMILIAISIDLCTTPYLMMLSFLIPIVSGIFVGLLISSIGICADLSRDDTFGIDGNTEPEAARTIILNLLGYENSRSGDGTRQINQCDFNTAMTVILLSALPALYGFLGRFGPSGQGYAVYGGACSVIGVLLVAAGSVYPRGSPESVSLFVFGIVVAVVGLIFSILSLAGNYGGWLVLGILGIITSLIALVIGVYGYVNCP